MTQSSTNQITCISLITGTIILIANKTILWLYYLIPSIRFIILLPFPFPFTIWIRWIIEVPALVVVSVKRHYTGGEKKIFYYQLNKMITNSEQLWKENKKKICINEPVCIQLNLTYEQGSKATRPHFAFVRASRAFQCRGEPEQRLEQTFICEPLSPKSRLHLQGS